MMNEFSGFFVFAVYCLWILVQLSTQVEAFFNEGISPVKVGLDVWHQRNTRLAAQTNDQLNCETPANEFYICEEPPYTVSFEETKTCNYRNQQYHEQVYRWVAGRGCLFYTPDFLFVNGTNTINLNAACVYGNLFAPCLEMVREDGTCGCYPFDPGLEKVVNAVREALIPAIHGRWERCFYAAADCCSHYMNGITSDESQCEATFDGWTCWQAAEPDSTVNEVCSEFAYSNTGPSCNHFSSKHCYANATWELQTDYTTCSITSRLLRRYRYHIAILSFSIASCLPAVFVFFFYKRLRITRVALHRNLLIAIIVRNILVIVSRSEIYIDEITNAGDTAMSTHGVACRVLAVAERIAANTVFVCMMVEGIYLHSLIVAVFKQKFNTTLLYGLGAVIAIVPVVVWATVMGVHNDHSCWLVYTIDHVQWILDVPRIAILIINTALFINVLRVLLTKIRNSENANQLSTAKATLFLMPIFGTQFLLTAFRPNTTNCTWEQTYYYLTYGIEGLQGFIVALLYCYINKEVHVLVKATYKKTENAVSYRVRGLSSAPRPSEGYSDRRITYSTGLPSVDGEYPNNSNAAIINKIHKAEIISLPNSERAAILEPIYETIVVGMTNDGYDSTTRSDIDNDSGFIRNRDSKTDDYYAYTNASSVSMEPKDCIHYTATLPANKSVTRDDEKTDQIDKNASNQSFDKSVVQAANQHNRNTSVAPENITEQIPELESNDSDLLDDILQYMEIFENKDVTLDPELLSPNRKDEDKINFVDF